jgi:hypothetical protein
MKTAIKQRAGGRTGGAFGVGLITAAVAFGLALGLASETLAVPRTINYQGLLVADDVPVDGTRGVRFRIYETSEGGTMLWQEVQQVAFSEGLFSVLLGAVEPIPVSVFSGSARWLSVSIEGGAEIMPRGEIASVAYAFNSATSQQADTSRASGTASSATLAANSDLLDGYDSSQFSGATHTHDTRYYSQTQLKTSDGSAPNQGSNYVHWNILNGVPEGFADGIDDTGSGGTIDHGDLTGLSDNDHPQYALVDSLETSDGSSPNQGSNAVHWDILTGVPGGFADGADDITTNASLITSGTMSPDRIAGTAIVDSDARLLTVDDKTDLTDGGETSLHSHPETGDISAVNAGKNLSGGGATGSVTLAHADDASTQPFAHHYPPFVVHAEADSFKSDSEDLVVVDSVVVDAPRDGFISVTFCGGQQLDLAQVGFPPTMVARRYIAIYGVGVDTSDAVTYYITSSMQDVTYYSLADGYHVPTKAVMGNTVRPVSAGQHTVYFLTKITVVIDADAYNKLESPSLTVTYFPYDAPSFTAARMGSAASHQDRGSDAEAGGAIGENPGEDR